MDEAAITREVQEVAGGHKGKLTWMWEDTERIHIRSQTKRRTPLKAETHTDVHTSALLAVGTSCQSWCGGQDEDSLPDSQDAITMGDTQRTTQTLSLG